jgi:hypothetical protein
MKVEITNPVHWDGEHRDCGDIIDVKDSDADWLMSRGKAVPYAQKASVENRSVALEDSPQPKLSKRTWKKSPFVAS